MPTHRIVFGCACRCALSSGTSPFGKVAHAAARMVRASEKPICATFHLLSKRSFHFNGKIFPGTGDGPSALNDSKAYQKYQQ